jgi:hypothetical protein
MATACAMGSDPNEADGKYGAEQRREIAGKNRGKLRKNRGGIACLAKSHY